MGVQLWACFLETDLQNPKKAQHWRWFIPLVGVECGRNQSRNPQGKRERTFPFRLARRCGQGQGPALRPLLSPGRRTFLPTKAGELSGCPPGEAGGITHFSSGCNHPSHTPGTARLSTLVVTLKAKTVGVYVEGFRKEGGRRHEGGGRVQPGAGKPSPAFGETAPRCRRFARPGRWRLPNRKCLRSRLILTGLVRLPRRGRGSHPLPCPSPLHATPKTIYSWPAPSQPDFRGDEEVAAQAGGIGAAEDCLLEAEGSQDSHFHLSLAP